jgi:hypothetical protein
VIISSVADPPSWNCPLYYQSGSASAGDIVQKPTANRIVSTTSQYALGVGQSPCQSGKAGWFRQVVKINTDQESPPHDIAYAGQSLTEDVTIGSPNGLNILSVVQYKATTNSNGQYGDTYYVCTPLCPSSNSNTLANQAITDLWQGSQFGWNNSLNYTCKGISENGH